MAELLHSEITDTKVMLESCLLQWADYNHSYDKIQKWLRDMEKRLRETEPKGDLSEKKAELQIGYLWQSCYIKNQLHYPIN
jgi:hypothetical protein